MVSQGGGDYMLSLRLLQLLWLSGSANSVHNGQNKVVTEMKSKQDCVPYFIGHWTEMTPSGSCFPAC